MHHIWQIKYNDHSIPSVSTNFLKIKTIEKFSKRGQEVQRYNYKLNKSQRYDAQHGFYGK